jgi:aminopeptidase N
MGFRRITYYPDRPDNMAVFSSVRLEANRHDYPVLLSNGNLVEQGPVKSSSQTDCESEERHYAIWSDPFPKPSYLFCAVAGNLASLQDTFTTQSGRTVQLEVFSECENVHQLEYAMESLKRSMAWDETTYGLEYDLDVYNIVAVNDFNMVRQILYHM